MAIAKQLFMNSCFATCGMLCSLLTGGQSMMLTSSTGTSPSKTIHCKYTIRQNGTTIDLRTYGMQTCGFAGIREIKHISWEWTV